MAHQLADLWPDDTIGVIKISDGGTGVRAFEKNWSFERANRTFDGKKGSFYKDLMHAVAEASTISKPEFCGFVWKQGGADGTKRDLAEEYYDTFKQLVSDLRTDLGAPDLPVVILSYMNDKDLLKKVLALMSEEELLEAKGSAGKGPLSDQELLKVVLSYMYDKDLPKERRLAPRSPYIGTVIMAQNRAGRDIPNVTSVNHGILPVLEDGIHFNAEGQIKLGKITASAVEAFYKVKEKRLMERKEQEQTVKKKR
jgi:lysophospholipase L1-like esterase